jgi:hypothetical protein
MVARMHKALRALYSITRPLVLCLGIAACVSTDDPNATFSAVRLYPMGSGQYMITCVDSPGYCARQATRSCPSGFDVVSNTTNPADYGRMTMIVKCH